MLRAREGDVERGIPIDPKVGLVTFRNAAEDMLNDYKANRKRTYVDAKRRINKHLAPFFGNRRLSSITASDIRAYIAKRMADTYLARPARRVRHRNGTSQDLPELRRPVSAGEINRELTVLKRMFSLAIEAGKLHHKPHFAMLREDNVRVGFFEREQYEAVLSHLPAGMRPVVTFAYVTGWRINSEVLPLRWRQVDLNVGEVRLDPGTTKNREGRVFYLTPELHQLLKEQRAAADDIQRQKKMIVQHVFFHRDTTKAGAFGHWAGKGISEHGFYHAWRTARMAAGCPGSIPHDFRRTAIRNMVRAGIPERVAMKLSGHKTRSVFDRYNVVSDGDLRDAARRLGHTGGHTGPSLAFGGGEKTQNSYEIHAR
ncbi:MAG TPA: site-specific integrase [Vicinamibacterales bacterium]|nr:site-specific integrase [Vicinamibacterales bacterium]